MNATFKTRSVFLPGEKLPRVMSSCPAAWQGGWTTIKLFKSVFCMRIFSVLEKTGTGPAAHLSQLKGRWFLIGDVVMTRSEIIASRAIPDAPTQGAICEFPVGAVVNVGMCSPLFGHPGGGWQAEWLPEQNDREPDMRPAGIWSDRWGRC